ncbi:MAG: sigma-70 family RNA polymerase sigma factor [Acidimicrobiia bacterium]|nr:sigma-70 family RNA polymerase sigma factor [Acidimicrobiia bacterium]
MKGAESSDRDVYEAIAPGLVRFATALVGPDDAGDVVSAVVVRVLGRRALSSLEKPEAYLMQAVMNEVRQLHRGRNRRRRAMVRVGPAPNIRDTADIARSDLTDAVMGLPPQQRAAAYLVYWCDYTSAEAAELMGWSDGTVRRYLHLVRGKLGRFADE